MLLLISSKSLKAQLPDACAIVEKFNARMVAAFKNGNYNAVAGFYADTAIIFDPSTTISGRAAIDKYWSGIRNAKDWKLTTFDCGGDQHSIWARGISELITFAPDGSESINRVNFVVILKKEKNAEYKIIVDIYNIVPEKKMKSSN